MRVSVISVLFCKHVAMGVYAYIHTNTHILYHSSFDNLHGHFLRVSPGHSPDNASYASCHHHASAIFRTHTQTHTHAHTRTHTHTHTHTHTTVIIPYIYTQIFPFLEKRHGRAVTYLTLTHLLHEPRGMSCSELAHVISAFTKRTVSSMHVLALRNDMQPFLSALGGVQSEGIMRIECSRMLTAIQRAGLHRESM
jgi:hypothetical protein